MDVTHNFKNFLFYRMNTNLVVIVCIEMNRMRSKKISTREGVSKIPYENYLAILSEIEDQIIRKRHKEM